MFSQEEFGKPISEELSNSLKNFTSAQDYANVSSSTGVSISTIKYVVLRNNSITESNSVAIVELIKIALQNCKEMMGTAKASEKYFESLLMISA